MGFFRAFGFPVLRSKTAEGGRPSGSSAGALDWLILHAGNQLGRDGECPVLRHWSEGSMVPVWYRSGTRVTPGKCRWKAGLGHSFFYSKSLSCAGTRPRGRASAPERQSRPEPPQSEGRRQIAECRIRGNRNPKPRPCDPQGTSGAPAGHQRATLKLHPSHPHASLMHPSCDPQATHGRMQKEECRMQNT